MLVSTTLAGRCVTLGTKYVTREEFEAVKLELEKLSIRVEVLSTDVHRLSHQVGDLAEDLEGLRDEMNSRFDALTSDVSKRFTSLEQTQAAILSAVMRLTPRVEGGRPQRGPQRKAPALISSTGARSCLRERSVPRAANDLVRAARGAEVVHDPDRAALRLVRPHRAPGVTRLVEEDVARTVLVVDERVALLHVRAAHGAPLRVAATKLMVLYGCWSTVGSLLVDGTCQILPTYPEQSAP